MGYILVGSLIRLKTLVYKINGAEYIKVYIKHNGELNPGVLPKTHLSALANGLNYSYQKGKFCMMLSDRAGCTRSIQ